jgi:ABC-type transport system involved in multi-copper enzyme maturation permease subunit
MSGAPLAARARRDRLGDEVAGIATIARLSLLEALRRRLLWALIGLTVLLVVVTAWAFQRLLEASPLPADETQLAVSQLLILVAFMFSFVLAMTAVFVGSPAIAGEVESGEALAILSRPIRRADVVLGHWVGSGIVVVTYAILAGLGEIGAVALTTGYLPPHPLFAAGFVALEGLVLLTLAVLLSTRLGVVTGGAIAVVLYGINWVMGVVGQAGAILGNDAIRTAGTISRIVMPTDVAWRGAMASLEPPAALLSSLGRTSVIFAVNPFYAAASPPPDQLAYAVVWIAVGLSLAIALFSRREL